MKFFWENFWIFRGKFKTLFVCYLIAHHGNMRRRGWGLRHNLHRHVSRNVSSHRDLALQLGGSGVLSRLVRHGDLSHLKSYRGKKGDIIVYEPTNFPKIEYGKKSKWLLTRTVNKDTHRDTGKHRLGTGVARKRDRIAHIPDRLGKKTILTPWNWKCAMCFSKSFNAVSQSINQSTVNESINQSIDSQRANQSINQSLNQWIGQSINQLKEWDCMWCAIKQLTASIVHVGRPFNQRWLRDILRLAIAVTGLRLLLPWNSRKFSQPTEDRGTKKNSDTVSYEYCAADSRYYCCCHGEPWRCPSYGPCTHPHRRRCASRGGAGRGSSAGAGPTHRRDSSGGSWWRVWFQSEKKTRSKRKKRKFLTSKKGLRGTTHELCGPNNRHSARWPTGRKLGRIRTWRIRNLPPQEEEKRRIWSIFFHYFFMGKKTKEKQAVRLAVRSLTLRTRNRVHHDDHVENLCVEIFLQKKHSESKEFFLWTLKSQTSAHLSVFREELRDTLLGCICR